MILTTRCELAVLDLAGTTVRDPGLVEAAIRRVTGASFNEHVFAAHRGGSKLDMLAALVGPDRATPALAEFEGDILQAIRAGAIEPLPYTNHVLHQIAGAGISICLTTGFSSVIRDALIKTLGWEQVIDLALSPNNGCRGRPWPDLILTAALHLKASDMAAIAVVGDTTNDVTAARRAHVGIAAAVLTGAHDRPTLESANPSHIFDHIGQFADLVVATTSTTIHLRRSRPVTKPEDA